MQSPEFRASIEGHGIHTHINSMCMRTYYRHATCTYVCGSQSPEFRASIEGNGARAQAAPKMYAETHQKQHQQANENQGPLTMVGKWMGVPLGRGRCVFVCGCVCTIHMCVCIYIYIYIYIYTICTFMYRLGIVMGQAQVCVCVCVCV